MLGVSGFVAGLGLAGPWLGLVEVTLTSPGLVGLGTEMKERDCLEVNSESCQLLFCNTAPTFSFSKAWRLLVYIIFCLLGCTIRNDYEINKSLTKHELSFE